MRQTALHIRQAVVYDDNQGFPTGVGQIIIKSEDEAWRTYRLCSIFNPQSPISDRMYSSAINQWMGGPELGRNTGTHQHPDKAYCWAYEKPTGNDAEIRLRSLYASMLSRKHVYATIADLARVSIHSNPYSLCNMSGPG